jgi:hypothetical protein
LQHYYDEHEGLYPITEFTPILPFEVSQKDINLMYNLCNKLIYGNYLKPEKYLGPSLKEESTDRKTKREAAWGVVGQSQPSDNANPKELGESTPCASALGFFAQVNVSLLNGDFSYTAKRFA